MRSGLIKSIFGQQARKAPDWAGLLSQSATDAPKAPVRAGGDSLALTPKLTNSRFSAHADLLGVLTGNPLTKGAKGEGVKALQNALLDLGFGLPSGADGGFGNEVHLALKGFQSSQGLPMTGELDAKTLKALDEVAPAEGKKAWEDPAISPKAFPPAPQVKGKPARIAVDTSEHRLFLYDKQGKIERIYPIATGAPGTETDPMIKIVSGFLKDPSSIARQLWPESGGKAFGTRLVDLSKYDPETGKITRNGEEIHGTFTRRSIGTDASHGCMRLYNEDIEDLYARLRQGDVVVVQK
jgi:lipoprotein-anchoring transpeptidase ErfK/SrfK